MKRKQLKERVREMLKKSKFNNQKGFTIIEVALVLAIAALIFLVVFLAVPALQRNQRDDARKRDVSNVVAQVTTMQSNTGQPVPTGTPDQIYNKDNGGAIKGNGKLGDYLDNMSNNVDYIAVTQYQDGKNYMPTNRAAKNNGSSTSTDASLNQILVITDAQCGDDDGNNTNSVVTKANKRASAVIIQIENGGEGKYYCQDAS